jgi:hypothetical protein
VPSRSVRAFAAGRLLAIPLRERTPHTLVPVEAPEKLTQLRRARIGDATGGLRLGRQSRRAARGSRCGLRVSCGHAVESTTGRRPALGDRFSREGPSADRGYDSVPTTVMPVTATPAPTTTSARIVERPPEARATLGDAPFTIRNRLPEHPLFEDDRIKRLLRTIPRDKVEIRRVEVAGAHDRDFKRGPRLTDVDPVAAFEGLSEQPTWMLLHDMWKHDADYAELMRQYVADLAESFEEVRAPLSDVGCWMFLSSGRSVVHFHADPDQSFLNQVRGGKTAFVYPARMLPESVVEELVYALDQGVVRYDPAYEPQMFPPTHLSPGESVFLPLYAPHRVINDDTVCVSWNVGFNTRRSRRRRDAHCVNLELRHMGMRPTPVGRRPWLDALKSGSRVAFKAKNKLLPFTRPKIDVKRTYGA